MKESFVLALLAFCLCADLGRAEFLESNLVPSLLKSRGRLTAASNSPNTLSSNPVPNPNECKTPRFHVETEYLAEKLHPYRKIDFFHKRSGTVSVTHHGVDVNECVQYCLNNNDSCLAVNYLHHTWTCQELETLGVVSVDFDYTSVFVNYKDGDDPCDEVYFVKGHVRIGYSYKSYHGNKAISAKDCCMKCKEDPESRCVAWLFDSNPKTCYLHEMASAMRTVLDSIGGYGLLRASSVA